MKTIDELNNLPDELTPEREADLLARKDAEESAAQDLILHTLKAATRFASAVNRGAFPVDELFSLAGTALLAAVRNYRVGPEPVRLLVYAKPYIRGEINKAWRLRDPIDYGSEIPEKSPDGGHESLSEEVVDPEFDRIHLREQWDLVSPHFYRLSETERRVLVLLYQAELTGAEIGRMIGCTRANIRETRLRALRKLRGALYRERKLRL